MTFRPFRAGLPAILVLSAAVLVGHPVAARAAVIGDLSAATPSSNESAGHRYFGETFTVPAGETGISTIAAIAHNSGGERAATIAIYAFDPGSFAFVGGPLFSAPILVPTTADAPVTAAAGLVVAAGQTLALVVAWDGGELGSVGSSYRTDGYYPDGELFFAGENDAPARFASYDLAFQVAFGAVPEPSSLAIAFPAFCALRRRR